MNQPQDNQNASQAVENPKQNIPSPAMDNVSKMMERRKKILSGDNTVSPEELIRGDGENKLSNLEPVKVDKLQNQKSEELNADSPNELQNQISKLNAKFEENQKYAREVSRKMSTISKNINQSVKELIDNGDLSEENGNNLLSYLNSNELKKPEGLRVDDEPKADPFQKFYDIANPLEIQNYKAYTRDEEYLNKIMAFNAFMKESSQEEIEDIYQTLDEISNNPPELVSKMMEIGSNFLDEGYRDLIKAGSLRKYMQTQKQKTINKEKEFDSLKKKTVKYNNDYDEPTYGFENNSISALKTNASKNEFFHSTKDNTQRFIEKRDQMIREQNKPMFSNHINRR